MNRTENTKKTLVAGVIIGIVFGWFLHTYASDDKQVLSTVNNTEAADINLDQFWSVWNTIQDRYYDIELVDEEFLVWGAIEGMVAALDDRHSNFLNPDLANEFNISLSGELVGIGAELTVSEGRLIISTPIKGAPAEIAGLLPNDFIFLIDGEPSGEMTLHEAVLNIRGEKGTEVTLTILREGEEDPLEITITRDDINVPSVDLTFVESDGQTIANLALYRFSNDTDKEFAAAVREILLEDVDGMILDLRLNGGGYLDASVEVLNHFFEDKVVALIVKSRGAENEVRYTSGKGQLSEIPLVLLIDEGSASSSEIVTGALQDHERATILGEVSFGKGTVQVVDELVDGSSLKLTIAKWFTPDDRNVDGVGIEPNIVVEMDVRAVDSEDDIQLQAAIDFLTEL